MNGFLLIDKPSGFTSFDVVALCRKIFHEKKIGHSGTLDPFATGLLVLALGQATKLLQYLPSSPKIYSGSGVFGVVTDTLDCEGSRVVRFSEDVVRERLNPSMIKKCVQEKFTGKILQAPPRYSALKIRGTPAYKLARRGEEFSMKPREVEIFDFQIEDVQLPSFSFCCSVTGGTYIRSLIAALGDELSVGAYTTSLRRTAIADFSLSDAITLDELRSYDGDVTDLLLPPFNV
jgi:tRNA pseudouridine55 synthase